MIGSWMSERRNRFPLSRSGPAQGCSGTFVERKAWTSGAALFGAAQAAGEAMPVIFSAAEADSGLIYSAVLADVVVDSGDPSSAGPETRYSFEGLPPIEPARRLSDLRKRSDGKPLSDEFIRPYAIVETPSFVSA